MSVFEGRGVFWWHDEAIAEGLLAPDAHVAGLLRIEDNGRAVLELDGYLSNPMARWRRWFVNPSRAGSRGF